MSDNLTHPLMPGIRCPEIHNPDWPRTLHDKQITGFSPLVCNMSETPEIWATLDIGGEMNWLEQVHTATGEPLLLVSDDRLRLVDLTGEVRWTAETNGNFFFFGNLRENNQDYLLIGSGPNLTLLDAATGKINWSHQFEPPHVHVRVEVGNILPDRPGLEAVVFLAYGEEGCLIHFPPEGDPQTVWQRTVIVPDEWPERHDHGCQIKLDLSLPEEPVVWNLRHHRCRGFNARTGKMLSSLVYRIDNGQLRNYGICNLGQGENEQPLLGVVAERVQKHVHAIRLSRNGENELAWYHYYGELYIVPGVAVEHLAIADMDGNGKTEIVYNVRDPEQNFRSFVRVRDADTGTILAELPDTWCLAACFNLGEKGINGLLTLPAPNGATPVYGDLTLHLFDPDLKPAITLPNAGLWGQHVLPGKQGNDLLLRRTDQNNNPVLTRYTLQDNTLHPAAQTSAETLLDAPIRSVLDLPDGKQIFFATGAALNALNWNGDTLWQLPLEGGSPPTLSAADLNGDGNAELAATAPGNRVRLFAFEDTPREIANHEFLGVRHRHSPLLYNLEDMDEYCLIAPGSTPEGHLAVRAYRSDGSLLWETDLGASTAQNGLAIAWNAGHFLPGPRAGVVVSVNNTLRNIEGSYMLDGLTGKQLWHRTIYRENNQVRPYIPHGIPTAFDIDNNGLEEIGLDMLSYMAFLRGTDGGFVALYPTENIQKENALYAGNLYNSYCPIYKDPDDTKPHWFVPLGGYGSFGLMGPDPREGIWREDPGYDIPHKIGLIDVDGDGTIEAGYTLKHSATFTCRNLWTGEIKWEIDLPSAPSSPVITADIDGDGKGEFLVGNCCIGTDANGQGEIRWQSPIPLGWAIIADFDGDGAGEIACANAGKIYILKGR